MIIITFVGLKTFLDNHMILVPMFCVVGFILSFILLAKWNRERLRGK